MATIRSILQRFWKTLGKTISPGSENQNTETQNGSTNTSNNTENLSSRKAVITDVKVKKIKIK